MLIEVEVSADEGPRAVAAALREAIARNQPFAAVVSMSAQTTTATGLRERIRILKELRPGLAAHCRGLVFVTTTPPRQKNLSRVWGCPTTTTDDLEQARAWARNQLAS
jgi:hypothetical protein